MEQTKKRNKSKTKYNIEDSGLDSLRIQRVENYIKYKKAKISDIKTIVSSSRMYPDDYAYLVNITIDMLTEQRNYWGFAHDLSITYTACVRIDNDVEEAAIQSVLNKSVPIELYDKIASIIYTTTEAAGCKLTSLSEQKFAKSIIDMGIQWN